MKTLLATASASVLLLAAAACSDAEAPRNTAGYATDNQATEVAVNADGEYVQTADASLDVDASTRTQYTLASGEMEASDLIGASVRNGTGDDIATVSDIFLGNDTATPQILVRDGGISGLGGDLRLVSFDAATVSGQPGEEPEVYIQISEANLEALPEFEQDGMNDYRLASEMIGTMTAISFSNEQARLNDLILSNAGELRYAVISPGLVSTDQVLVDADAIQIVQGDGEGEVMIDIDQATFDAAPMYRSN
ncbi:MAG: PRC-barrel domain-containing protein [Hyphomonas sp.]